MTATETDKPKPVLVPGSLHAALKIRAAQLGVKLGDMCADKLSELVGEHAELAASPAVADLMNAPDWQERPMEESK